MEKTYLNREIEKGEVMEVVVPSSTGEIKIPAYVLAVIEGNSEDGDGGWDIWAAMDYIMYSQNRIFVMAGTVEIMYPWDDDDDKPIYRVSVPEYRKTIAEYAVIPEADEYLKTYK